MANKKDLLKIIYLAWKQNGAIVLQNVREPKEFKVEWFTAPVQMGIQLWSFWRMNQFVTRIASKNLICNFRWGKSYTSKVKFGYSEKATKFEKKFQLNNIWHYWVAWTIDAKRRNSLHWTAKNSIPIPNF